MTKRKSHNWNFSWLWNLMGFLGVVSVIALVILLFVVGYHWLCGYHDGMDLLKPKKIERAVDKRNFKKAHRILDHMNDENVHWGECYTLILDEEINYLLYEQDEIAADRLISIIKDIPHRDYAETGTSSKLLHSWSNNDYNESACRYNGYCDKVLDVAISRNNKYVAEKIIEMYIPEVERSISKHRIIGRDEYKYEYTNKRREEAVERYEAAFGQNTDRERVEAVNALTKLRDSGVLSEEEYEQKVSSL